MKVLITGGKGMLGTDVVGVFRNAGIDFVSVDSKECDITQQKAVDELFLLVKPTHVINCAAYTAVDQAEDDREACRAVNVRGVKNLAQACVEQGCIFLQISTDYVFDGSELEYIENSPKSPINFYGRTKADAEDIIQTLLPEHIIVRTSWLFGMHGKNFVKTIQSLAHIKNVLRVVNDQVGCPTYTKDLAQVILLLVQQDARGIFHVTNSRSCSWFEFALEIVTLSKLPCAIVQCSSDEFPQKAKRPRYSVLKNTKLKKLRSWREALQGYMNEIV